MSFTSNMHLVILFIDRYRYLQQFVSTEAQKKITLKHPDYYKEDARRPPNFYTEKVRTYTVTNLLVWC